VLLGLIGALSILVGLLCLRQPLQTIMILGLLIGATWVVGGIVTVVRAFGGQSEQSHGWTMTSGILSTIGGVVILVYPGISLVAIIWFLGVVLVVTGAVFVIGGFVARRPARPQAMASTPPTATPSTS
jgi:uncharacterized membrane protein HdeD (DUF308 family)